MTTLRILERTPCFAHAEPAILSKLADLAETQSLRRGDILWKAGDLPKAFTVLRSGVVKMVRPVARGRSAICGFAGAPDSVGDLAALSGKELPTSAIVVSDRASVIIIPRAPVIEAIRQSAALANAMTCALHEKMAALHHKIEILSAGTVEARLATLLLQLYQQFGDELEDGTWRVPIALTRQELADLVSTSFETAIRVMSRWERENVLVTDSEGFTFKSLQTLKSASGEPEIEASAAE